MHGLHIMSSVKHNTIWITSPQPPLTAATSPGYRLLGLAMAAGEGCMFGSVNFRDRIFSLQLMSQTIGEGLKSFYFSTQTMQKFILTKSEHFELSSDLKHNVVL